MIITVAMVDDAFVAYRKEMHSFINSIAKIPYDCRDEIINDAYVASRKRLAQGPLEMPDVKPLVVKRVRFALLDRLKQDKRRKKIGENVEFDEPSYEQTTLAETLELIEAQLAPDEMSFIKELAASNEQTLAKRKQISQQHVNRRRVRIRKKVQQALYA